jgi:ubiquitin fusion degradation protein 1
LDSSLLTKLQTRNYYQGDELAAMHAMMQRRGGPARRFDEQFRVYPIPMLSGPDRPDAVYGGKIFLPPSALEKLTRLHIEYPMLFELINGALGKHSHAGVLEFVAEEGKVYLPQWVSCLSFADEVILMEDR